MRIKFLGHSGFLVEWEDISCLFDWSEGDLPYIDPNRRLHVFVSHSHSDHFREDVFALAEKHEKALFILSSDVPAHLPAGSAGRVVHLTPGSKRRISGGRKGVLTVFALGSTDEGVAFLVNYGGKTVYHAGDLHWWAWPDDTPEEAFAMKERFFREISVLKGLELDAAFLPLDARLEDNFWLGFDAVMRTANIRNAFPMHMWGDYGIIEKLRRQPDSAPYQKQIHDIWTAGQIIEIEKER